MSQEDPTSLPASVDSLRQLVLRLQQETAAAQKKAAAARREAAVEKARVAELLSTVASQKAQLERNERTIRDLLAALKGKTRERIDPNQLLFDRGELEQLIEERAAEEGEEPRRPRRGRVSRGPGGGRRRQSSHSDARRIP